MPCNTVFRACLLGTVLAGATGATIIRAGAAELELEFAGRQAWRTRVSELRKAPYFMRIENRVRVVRYSGPLEPGRSRHFKVSEYLYRPSVEAHEAQ